MIAVPTRGSIRWETATRLQGHNVIFMPGNLSVAVTRNKIVDLFLAGTDELLVMVDDDIVPPPSFMNTFRTMPERFVMGAIPHPCPHPIDPSELILTAYDFNEEPVALDHGWNEVNYVATGCVAIRREVLEPNCFEITDHRSDDFRFCDRLHSKGAIGAFYDGWICDHSTTVNLAPLYTAQMKLRGLSYAT